MAQYLSIKKDVTFSIEVGGNTLINLQRLLMYILADKTEKEILDANEKISKQEYEEDWHEHYAFLAIMISVLENTAHEKGLTVMQEYDDTKE